MYLILSILIIIYLLLLTTYNLVMSYNAMRILGEYFSNDCIHSNISFSDYSILRDKSNPDIIDKYLMIYKCLDQTHKNYINFVKFYKLLLVYDIDYTSKRFDEYTKYYHILKNKIEFYNFVNMRKIMSMKNLINNFDKNTEVTIITDEYE